jgi:hypothetical protein
MQSGLTEEESGGAQVAYLFAIQNAEMPKNLACCITRDRHCFSIASQRQDIAVHCLLANAHRIKSHRIPYDPDKTRDLTAFWRVMIMTSSDHAFRFSKKQLRLLD